MVVCPDCGEEAKFVEEYQKYYCNTCKKYLPEQQKSQEPAPLPKITDAVKEENYTEIILLFANWVSLILGLYLVPILLFFLSKNPRVKKHAKIAIFIIILIITLIIIGITLFMRTQKTGDDLTPEENLSVNCYAKCMLVTILFDEFPPQEDDIEIIAEFCCHNQEVNGTKITCLEYYPDCPLHDKTAETFCKGTNYDFTTQNCTLDYCCSNIEIME